MNVKHLTISQSKECGVQGNSGMKYLLVDTFTRKEEIYISTTERFVLSPNETDVTAKETSTSNQIEEMAHLLLRQDLENQNFLLDRSMSKILKMSIDWDVKERYNKLSKSCSFLN